jgi:hypothetical protein
MESFANEMSVLIWTKAVAPTTAPTPSEDTNVTALVTCPLSQTEKHAASTNAETTMVVVLKCASTHLQETHVVASNLDTIPLSMESTA